MHPSPPSPPSPPAQSTPPHWPPTGSDTRNSLFHIAWKPAEAATRTVDLDEVDIYVPDIDTGGDGPAAAHAATEALLTHLQSWLAANDATNRRLVILTQHAIATSPAEDINLTHAPYGDWSAPPKTKTPAASTSSTPTTRPTPHTSRSPRHR